MLGYTVARGCTLCQQLSIVVPPTQKFETGEDPDHFKSNSTFKLQMGDISRWSVTITCISFQSSYTFNKKNIKFQNKYLVLKIIKDEKEKFINCILYLHFFYSHSYHVRVKRDYSLRGRSSPSSNKYEHNI